MKELSTLYKFGLVAMSKSLEHGFWLHGHAGAEILTNAYFLEELATDSKLTEAIHYRIDHLIDAKASYFDENLILLEEKNSIEEIERAVLQNAERLSTAGHGVIFGALILKAIRKLDGWLPKQVHDGLISLLVNTQSDFPERYYGAYDYQNVAIDLSDIPAFESPEEAARYTLKNQVYHENQEVDGKFYFFHGKQIHHITHANALLLLKKLGYDQIVSVGLQELRKQIKLGHFAPEDSTPFQSSKTYSPLNPSFWVREVEDEHHFKLAYAVMYLLKKFPDIDQQEVLKKVSGHWELMQ